MATDTKTIKHKMKSVQNIGKITKAMEMISVSKMKKSASKRLASSVFAKHSFQLLENLHLYKNLTHPYLQQGAGTKVLMLIIASNKGLCGGYNINVSKQISKFIKTHPGTHVDAIVIGKQAQRIAGRNNINVLASFTDFSDYFSGSEVRSFFHSIIENYHDGLDYREVVVAYTEFVSAISYNPKIQSLIPLSVDTAQKMLGLEDLVSSKRKFALYSFEPTEQEVLDRVVPSVLMSILYQFLLESLASEHSARVAAMRNASDNAKDMLEELKINYNRARQAAITQEIAEIVGGASAMS